MKCAVAASDKILPVAVAPLSRALLGQARASFWSLGQRTATLSSGSFASNEASAKAFSILAPPQAAAQEYADVGYEVESIGEVDWNAQLVNAVSLVGRLGRPLELRKTANSSLATGALAVSNPKTAKIPTSWFRLEIWGPLAEVAAQQLQKGDQIQVLGRLRSNEYTDKEGNARKDIGVAVSSISRVRSGYSAPAQQNQDQEWGQQSQAQESYPGYDDQTAGVPGWSASPSQQQQQTAPKGKSSADMKWNKFFSDRNSYYDNRFSKTKPTQPDFKHKTNRDEALWLDGAPEWVLTEINSENPVAPL